MKGVLRRTCALAVAATVATIGPLITGTSSASAAPFTTPPSDAESAELWLNPQARTSHDSALQVSVRSLSSPLPTSETTLTIAVEITNTSSRRLTLTAVNAGVGDPIPDASTARLRLADRQTDRTTTLVDRELDRTIAAGDSTDIRLTLPLDSLSTGLYQLTISAVGQQSTASGLTPTTSDSSADTETLTAETRVLVPLQSTPAATATTPAHTRGDNNGDGTGDNRGDGTGDNGGDTTGSVGTTGVQAPSPVPFTLLWPISAPTHVAGGESGQAPEAAPLILTNDNLADELAPDGRLSHLIDSYMRASAGEQGDAFRSATCLAFDPDLLRTVQRMAQGYTINAHRPNPVKVAPRLRESWFTDTTEKGSPGEGAQAAHVWLEKAQLAARDNCVVPLPTATADLNAVARTGNSRLVAQSVIPGPHTVEEILQTPVVHNLLIPGSGYLTQATANVYTATGRPAETVQNPDPAADAPLPQLWSGSAPADVLVARNTLRTDRPSAGPAGPAGPGGSAGSVGSVDESVAEPSASIFSVPTQPSSTTIARDQQGDNPPPTSMRAVTFNAELGAMLAATGEQPSTAAYASPISRYLLNLDSPTARIENAIAVLWQQVQYGTPVLAVPPADWSVNSAQADALTAALTDMFAQRQIQPRPLPSLLNEPARGSARFSAPYPDPGVIPDVEVQRAGQQAQSIGDLRDIMVNDPKIVLTRDQFVSPLRTGLLRALTTTHRRQYGRYDQATKATTTQLHQSDQTLRQLFASVSLLTPGNVFARSSDDAPLLIVARNGLPLPVPTILGSQVPDGVAVDPVDQILPAKGSITLQVSIDVPPDSRRTDVQLWLASPDGSKISDDVTVALQPPPGVGKWGAIAVLIVLIGIGVVAQRFQAQRRGERRERRRLQGPGQPRAPDPSAR